VSSGKASTLREFARISKMAGVGGKDKTGQKSFVVLSARAPREVPLNVTAVWSSGKRIFECVLMSFPRVLFGCLRCCIG